MRFVSALPTAALLAFGSLTAPCGTPLAGPGELEGQRLHLGAKAGVNAARQIDTSDDWEIASDRRAGVVGGLEAGLDLIGPLRIQVEALYTEKGSEHPDGSRTRLAYLEFPFLLRYAPDLLGSEARPYLAAGGAMGREVSCSGRVRPADGSPGLEPVECDRERTFRGDGGLIVAIGGSRPVGGWTATAELRYTRGLRDLVGAHAVRSRTNRVLSLVIGLGRALDLPGT